MCRMEIIVAAVVETEVAVITVEIEKVAEVAVSEVVEEVDSEVGVAVVDNTNSNNSNKLKFCMIYVHC